MICAMITCFDIGGSAIKYAVALDDGSISELRRVPTPTQDLAAFVAALRELMKLDAPTRGIAISIAGVVDPNDGRIQCANIPCINGRKLADELESAFGLPIWIINDADSFVLAETYAGAGQGHTHVFGLILGTGVGGGLVLDGRLVSGPGGISGEWGHGPVAAQFAGNPARAIPRLPCGCGQTGCLDTVGGARGLEKLHHALHQSNMDSRAIIAAWQADDAAAAITIDCYIDLLAGPLAMLVNTLGVTILPVGGGLSNSAPLIARLDVAVRAAILRRTSVALIVPAQAGAEPGLIGAAWLGREKLERMRG